MITFIVILILLVGVLGYTSYNLFKKVEKLVEEGRNLESEYYLSNEEVENIFDIIENIEDIEY